MGNIEYEVIFSGGKLSLLAFSQFLILFLDLFHLLLVLLFDVLLTVRDYDHEGVAGMHLVEGVHHYCEGVVSEYK